jgi:hypothetical protein
VRAQAIDVQGDLREGPETHVAKWCPKKDPRIVRIKLTPPSAIAAVRAIADADGVQVSLRNAGGAVVMKGELPLEHVTATDAIATIELAVPADSCVSELELDAPEGPLLLHTVPPDALAAVDRDLAEIRKAVDTCTPKALDPWLHYPVERMMMATDDDSGEYKTAKSFAAHACDVAKEELQAQPDVELQRTEIGRDRIAFEASWECVAGTATCYQDFVLVWDGKHWKLAYLGDMGGGD